MLKKLPIIFLLTLYVGQNNAQFGWFGKKETTTAEPAPVTAVAQSAPVATTTNLPTTVTTEAVPAPVTTKSSGFHFPNIDLPKIDLPKVDFSKLTMPNITLPTLPPVHLPNITIPKFEVPNLSLPDIKVLAPPTVKGIAFCILGEVKDIAVDFVHSLSMNPGNAICGPKIFANVMKELRTQVSNIRQCSGVSCYLGIVKTLPNLVVSSGKECAADVLSRLSGLKKRVTLIAAKCAVKPNFQSIG